MTIKSVYESNSECLQAIISLHIDGETFDCDCTYGNGAFYKEMPEPRLKFDIDPQVAGVQSACSQNLPLSSQSISSLIFDPPFLTYIRAGRGGEWRNGNG